MARIRIVYNRIQSYIVDILENMGKKKANNNVSNDRFNTDFWKEQRRKTLIESAGASVRLSGSKVTNEEVAKIIDSEKKNDKEYMLLFVEEMIQNPKYKDWAAGRMEIRLPDEKPHSINEVRFFTPRNNEWTQFVDKYNGKAADQATVDQVTKIVKEKFYQVTEAE